LWRGVPAVTKVEVKSLVVSRKDAPLNSHIDKDESDMDTPATSKVSRKKIWITLLAGMSILLICSCTILASLVLNGAIAEPEALLNQILEFLLGG
jgi:hypothetical protein